MNASEKEPGVLKVFQLPRVWGLPSISPPCTRLETWLRMTNIPYEFRIMDLVQYPAPKGKVPYVEDAGVLMGDSELILTHLKKTRHVDPDLDLNPHERAVGTAFSRMLMENTYWLTVHDRYAYAPGWEIYRKLITPMLTSGFPEEQHAAVVDAFKEKILAGYHGHGMGRHTSEEVLQIGSADLVAVSVFLADKPFFFGEKPTSLDAAAYGVLSNLIEVPLDTPIVRFSRSLTNLVDFCRRMRERFFPDLEAS